VGITIPISIGRRGGESARSRVLIVDEHPLVGGVLCEGLAGLGYEAMHCSDAQEALQLCRTGVIDAVLCEVGLRTRRGLRLTDALVRELPHLPVAILTAWLDHPDAGRVSEQGVPVVLQKPIRFEQLDRALRNLTAARAVVQAN
jgi:CheY-like chemotaxis protein